MEQKLQGCATALNKIVFNSVAASLFKPDRLMFGLHITHGVQPHLFDKNEWEYLLFGAAQAE